MTTDKEKQDAIVERLDKTFAKFAKRPVLSTDFGPLPESEWTPEEREQGFRIVARRNPDDPTRLDVFGQYLKPLELVSVNLDLKL